VLVPKEAGRGTFRLRPARPWPWTKAVIRWLKTKSTEHPQAARELDEFREVFPNPLSVPNARGWMNGRCPAHDDRNPSFGREGGRHGIVLHCQAGCTADAICSALGIDISTCSTRIVVDFAAADSGPAENWRRSTVPRRRRQRSAS